MAVAAPGREPLVTQFYVAGELLNERDGLFNALRDPRQREAVLLHLEPAERIETGALLGSGSLHAGAARAAAAGAMRSAAAWRVFTRIRPTGWKGRAYAIWPLRDSIPVTCVVDA